MKTKIYLRIAKTDKGRTSVAASVRPNYEPLMCAKPHNVKLALPTLSFAVEFEVPDELFKQAESVVATINLTKEKAVICGKVAQA